MPRQVSADERADRHELPVAVVADVLEDAPRELRPETVLLQALVDLGVDHADHAVAELVHRLPDLMAVALEHVAVMLRIVDDGVVRGVAHGATVH